MKAEPQLLSRMYHAIMLGFVRDGRAPHYTNLAHQLGLGIEDARLTLHELIEMGLPTWLAPNTDYIASFAPFSGIPTQYLVAVDGQQRWYAQCGFESLAISWLFPGREVRIDCPCLDCGEGIHLRMRDGKVLAVDPPTVVGHVNLPAWRWRENWAHT
jgi:hypothetical protein